MEINEGRESRMIPWWVALIAWVIGELMGFGELIICMGSTDKAEEQRRKQQIDSHFWQ